jgi:2'-hydroxyisoflavone reductase
VKILVLGGTVFVGRYFVEAAVAHGHELTLFNRGKHNPDLFPDLEKLRGERDGGLDALRGRSWDAVVDTCGFVPRIVSASASLLADAVGHYTFISTIGVYADFSRPGLNETSPVGTLEDENVEQVTGETYGPLKALCERAAERAMGGRVLNVRAGAIVGPHDGQERIPYWTARAARGGEFIAPLPRDAPVQYIDVRDLAEWILHMIENGAAGTYNTTGPDYPLTRERFLDECAETAQGDGRAVWIDEEFLVSRDVHLWGHLPLCAPSAAAGLVQADVSRAIGAGLSFRPLAETLSDTLDWHSGRGGKLEGGLTEEGERDVLAEWRASRSGDAL